MSAQLAMQGEEMARKSTQREVLHGLVPGQHWKVIGKVKREVEIFAEYCEEHHLITSLVRIVNRNEKPQAE